MTWLACFIGVSEVMNKAWVNRIIPFSNVDGPGNRLAVFFQGCNYRCVYCHNPETLQLCSNCMECISSCPSGAIANHEGIVQFMEELCISCDACIHTCRHQSSPKARLLSVADLIQVVSEYKPFIRGITVSGGEPTLWTSFVEELFIEVKKLGLSCFVDTNGCFDIHQIHSLIETADQFMVDIKAAHGIEKVVGVSLANDALLHLKNLNELLYRGKVYEVRTVIIMDYMDGLDTVRTVGEILRNYPEVHYKLIRVHTQGLTEKQREKVQEHIPTDEYMKMLAEQLKQLGVANVEIIG